ncbi:hypothetical protein ACFQL1_07260 [Halomicroarcula sp. GCM10025709]
MCWSVGAYKPGEVGRSLLALQQYSVRLLSVSRDSTRTVGVAGRSGDGGDGGTVHNDSSSRTSDLERSIASQLLYAKFGRLLLFVVLVAITLYPSSVSGQQRSGPELSAGRVESLVEALGVISIPFFDASSLLPRLEQTVQGLLIVRPHVLTGIGAANWKYVPEVTMRLHNAYLTLLVWTGLVGVVLYLCSLLLALRHGRALLRTVEDKLLYVGLIAGVVGFSASIFFRPFDRLTLLVPLWVVLGVLVGESQRIDRLSNGSWEHDD